MPTVPCSNGCGTRIPAARAAIAITKGMCVPCNRLTLECSRVDLAPMYETDAWSRGIKL